MNIWNNLPNGIHIDWVLESSKTHPYEWSISWECHTADDSSGEMGEARYNAKEDTSDSCRYTGRDPFMDAILDATRGAVFKTAAKDAVLSLVVYDHAAKYLDMTYDELLTWSHLNNDPAAILLLPALIVRELINEKQMKNKGKK